MFLRHLHFYIVSLYNNPFLTMRRFTLLRALQTITTRPREICLWKSKRLKPLRISRQGLPDHPGFSIRPVSPFGTYFLIDVRISISRRQRQQLSGRCWMMVQYRAPGSVFYQNFRSCYSCVSRNCTCVRGTYIGIKDQICDRAQRAGWIVV